MTFFVDPKLKAVGESEMKDWIIFGLIILVLGFGGYNVSNNLRLAHDKLSKRVLEIEARNIETGPSDPAIGWAALSQRVDALEKAKTVPVIKKKGPRR